jgi:predicted aspartyl protease
VVPTTSCAGLPNFTFGKAGTEGDATGKTTWKVRSYYNNSKDPKQKGSTPAYFRVHDTGTNHYLVLSPSSFQMEMKTQTVRGVNNLSQEAMPRGRRRGRSDLTTKTQRAKKRFASKQIRSPWAGTNHYLVLSPPIFKIQIKLYKTVRGIKSLSQQAMPRGRRRGRSVLTTKTQRAKKGLPQNKFGVHGAGTNYYPVLSPPIFKIQIKSYKTVRGIKSLSQQAMPRGRRRGRSDLTTIIRRTQNKGSTPAYFRVHDTGTNHYLSLSPSIFQMEMKTQTVRGIIKLIQEAMPRRGRRGRSVLTTITRSAKIKCLSPEKFRVHGTRTLLTTL